MLLFVTENKALPDDKKTGGRKSNRPKPPLAGRLKRVAQGAGFTSETISEQLGLTAGAVRNWWVGKNEPSVEMLVRYAGLTGVSVSYLLTGKENDKEAGSASLRKAQVIQVLDAAVARFTALPARLVQTPPELTADLAGYEHQDRLRLAVATILDEVQATYGRPWAELTKEERDRVLSELADTLLTSDEQPGEAAQEDS